MATPTPAFETIADVLAQMDRIIERCRSEGSKLGYFAALYRDVTVRVRDGIAAGRFEDGPRMERLDVLFANRYLDALARFQGGKRPTKSWSVAFRAAREWTPIILQHLLLGMNAHINLDLAIAAARTAPGDRLPALRRDFEEITVLLDEMIRGVQERIERVSPWFRIIDRVGGRTDEQICGFAMREARDLAWKAAGELAVLEPERFEREIARHDEIVAVLGRGIRSPGPLLRAALLLIRVRESKDVSAVIETLRM